jgi:hypothetical protein
MPNPIWRVNSSFASTGPIFGGEGSGKLTQGKIVSKIQPKHYYKALNK